MDRSNTYISLKGQLKFYKFRIHGCRLFAMENIAAGEMVIEYVGKVVNIVLCS